MNWKTTCRSFCNACAEEPHGIEPRAEEAIDTIYCHIVQIDDVLTFFE
jgi:hypothetical protein